MTWIFFALISRLFAAANNVVDSYVVHKFGTRRILASIVLQNLTALLPLIGIALLHGIPGKLESGDVIWMNIGVLANLGTLYPYLTALHKDENRNAASWFQFLPLALIALAIGVTGEAFSLPQIGCAFLIAACGFFCAWDFRYRRLDKAVILPMLGASVLFALFYLALRQVGAHNNPIEVFWHINLGFFLSAVVMTIVYPRIIGSIRAAVASTRGRIILYELLNGILAQGAALAVIVGLALAPGIIPFAALLGTQGLFVAVIAGLAGLVLKDAFAPPPVRDVIVKAVLAVLAAAACVWLIAG